MNEMTDNTVFRDGKKLRCGFTTGSCAAAASAAAVEMLLTGKPVEQTRILTPGGVPYMPDIEDISITSDAVSCAVRKDGGDDPDVTSGLLIYARVEKTAEGIVIGGGEGVGRVTKEGLDQPVGASAINSVPRRMMTEAVSRVCRQYHYDGGIRITVYVPDGEEIARKTYNPRMGIEGGISIIGTTGIVEPMSSAALIDTIRLEERMRRAEGKHYLLLTVGNYSKSFLAEQMPFLLDRSVTCSNFIGEAIDAALAYAFRGILIIGHIGKLVKLGAGIMNTHSAQADGRMDVLVTCGVLAGGNAADLREIPECATVDAALGLLDKAGIRQKTTDILMRKAQYYLDAKVKGGAEIGAVMFSYQYGFIGQTAAASHLIEKITEEYHG